MQAQGISFYERQKREAKRILRRIENRHYEEVQSERSEGFYIVDDLKDELRRNYQRAETQKIMKSIRRKEITEHFRKSLQENNQQASFSQLIGMRPIGRINNQSKKPIEISRRGVKRLSNVKKVEIRQVLKQVVNQLKNSQKDINIMEKQNETEFYTSNLRKPLQSQDLANILNYTECKSFLPMLQLYTQQRLFLKTMSVNQKKNHIIITQMLLLALARRKNNKLLDSLDILIEIDRYFPKDSSQMQQLKAVWYQLIAKLHIQIKSNESQPQKRNNRWKKSSIKSTVNDLNQIKRQKTLIIKSIASKRNFLNRVQVQMKKVSLIYESSYQRESTNYLNAIEDQAQERIIVSRISKKYAMSYPQPSSIFPTIASIVNYGVIIINRDPDNNLFPNHYPNSLEGIIGQDEYTSTFCKINSFLIPQNRCFSYQTALYANFQPIFVIFIVILLSVVITIVLVKKSSQNYGIMVGIVLAVISVGLSSVCIHSSSKSSVGKGNEIYFSINKILVDWTDKYEQDVIKFTLSEKADMIIISFPKPDELQELASSLNGRSERSYTYSSKRKTFSLSTGNQLVIDQPDQIIEKEDSIEEGGAQVQQQLFEDEENDKDEDLSVSSDEIEVPESEEGERRCQELPLKQTLIIFDEFEQEPQQAQ